MIDVVWIVIAFALGLLARLVALPPLTGYLAAGFVLYALGVRPGGTLAQVADLGITLLLFTIGLKLRIQTLLRPQVWAVASIHLVISSAVLAGVVLAMVPLGLALMGGIEGPRALLLGFALSFSSTVFAVKVLEERADIASVYGRTAIGILIVQDIAAVLFLAASTGKVPTPWALLLLASLWPLRWLLFRLLDRVGHGELLILFGFTVALGGGQLFDLVGIKGDLGALLIGVLMGGHRNADELAKVLLSFKDIFLVGFFLGIGLQGIPGPEALGVALLLTALLPLKGALFFALLTAFRLRVRTSLLATLGLANYSEFGLIVAAIGAAQGWIPVEWLTTLAVALALSFLVASPLNAGALGLYRRWRGVLSRFEGERRLPEEQAIDPGDAAVLVFGMGRVGVGAYDRLVADGVGPVVGIDSATEVVARHRAAGREVIRASGTDLDFWDRITLDGRHLRLVLLTMPRVHENEFAAEQLLAHGFQGRITALAKFEDDERLLRAAGAHHVFNLYREAGAGLAEDALRGTESAPA